MFRTIALAAAVLGTGIIAGTFFAFSNFVMAALARLPAANGISAMQSINITVINPLFMTALFGTGLLLIYLGFDAWRNWGDAGTALIVIAAVCYIVGTLVVTMALNVPLNDAMAAVTPESAEGQRVWSHYLDRWTMWNHVRTLAALVACCLCFLAGR